MTGAIIVAGPAHATNGYVTSGAESVNTGSTNRRASTGWNASNNPPTLGITAALLNGITLPSGWCFDAWFDWAPTSGDHYDARGVRTCKSGTSYSSPNFTEPHTMYGMQKDGGAYGPNNATTGNLYVDAPDAVGSVSTINVNFSTSVCSHEWWRLNSDGTAQTFSGGDPTSASC